jgi:hypothetical protein
VRPPANHPWRGHLAGSPFPDGNKADAEIRLDVRVRELLQRTGPMSARAVVRLIGGTTDHAVLASLRRLKCQREGAGAMCRWRLPQSPERGEENP